MDALIQGESLEIKIHSTTIIFYDQWEYFSNKVKIHKKKLTFTQLMRFVEESQNPFVVDYLFLLFLLDFKIAAYRPKPNIFRQSNGR